MSLNTEKEHAIETLYSTDNSIMKETGQAVSVGYDSEKSEFAFATFSMTEGCSFAVLSRDEARKVYEALAKRFAQ